jgi:hypothetical protein
MEAAEVGMGAMWVGTEEEVAEEGTCTEAASTRPNLHGGRKRKPFIHQEKMG